MGCSNSRINNEKIDHLEKERIFLKSDLEKIQKIIINTDDYLEFQEKFLIPNGEMYRYKYNKLSNEFSIKDQFIEEESIFISADLGMKINKKDALEILENDFIRKKTREIGILKNNQSKTK